MSKDTDELADHILTAVFPARGSHADWVADSQALIAAVPIARNDEYFVLLDDIPSLEERLDYLTDGSARERIYILHLVGQWLRADRDAVIQSQKLRDIYPALYAYLDDSYPDEALKLYFGKYKTYKLSNTLPVDEETYFAGFDTEDYEYRYPVLSDEAAGGETFVLWIDALGAEWLPLLQWALQTFGEGDVSSVKVTQAVLPSETKFNDLWNQMELPSDKYDKLDKLAHKGVIDHIGVIDEIPHDIMLETDGPIEVSGIGGLVLDGVPHLHCSFADHDRAWVGHLESGCQVAYVGEITLIELLDVDAKRIANQYGVKEIR